MVDKTMIMLNWAENRELIQHIALNLGASAEDAEKFANEYQIQAFIYGVKADGTKISAKEALKFKYWPQAEALRVGLRVEDAEKFKYWPQVEALKLKASIEDALECQTLLQGTALIAGFSVEEALKMNHPHLQDAFLNYIFVPGSKPAGFFEKNSDSMSEYDYLVRESHDFSVSVSVDNALTGEEL